MENEILTLSPMISDNNIGNLHCDFGKVFTAGIDPTLLEMLSCHDLHHEERLNSSQKDAIVVEVYDSCIDTTASSLFGCLLTNRLPLRNILQFCEKYPSKLSASKRNLFHFIYCNNLPAEEMIFIVEVTQNGLKANFNYFQNRNNFPIGTRIIMPKPVPMLKRVF